MCRLAVFSLSVHSHLSSCHSSLSTWTCTCFHGLQRTTNTWEDKCSVELNKQNPGMLRSSLYSSLHRERVSRVCLRRWRTNQSEGIQTVLPDVFPRPYLWWTEARLRPLLMLLPTSPPSRWSTRTLMSAFPRPKPLCLFFTLMTASLISSQEPRRLEVSMPATNIGISLTFVFYSWHLQGPWPLWPSWSGLIIPTCVWLSLSLPSWSQTHLPLPSCAKSSLIAFPRLSPCCSFFLVWLWPGFWLGEFLFCLFCLVPW